MQPGWTYMFEAIYTENMHVISYPFEGCVLLDAVDPDGYTLPDTAAKAALAGQLGVMTVPSLHGSWDELMQRLGEGCFKPAAQTRSSQAGARPSLSSCSNSSLPANYEGWVLQAADGQRCKLVQLGFKKTGHMAKHRLHPLVVWDAVCCGVSRSDIMQGLPSHYQGEADAILTALDHRFRTIHDLLQQEVENSWQLGGSEAGSRVPAAAAKATAEVPAVSGAPATRLKAEGAEIAGSACNSDSSNAASSAAFQLALQYALQKDTHIVNSMYSSSSRHWKLATGNSAAGSSKAPGLRGLILGCIRPGTDGSLPGYTPSPAFKQTYAKGWLRGPQEGRMSVLAPQPLILLNLSDEATLSVLKRVHEPGSRNIGNAMLVCRDWRRLIEGDPGFKTEAAEWQRRHDDLQRRCTVRRSSYDSGSSYSYSDSYYGGDYYDDCGYGSP